MDMTLHSLILDSSHEQVILENHYEMQTMFCIKDNTETKLDSFSNEVRNSKFLF